MADTQRTYVELLTQLFQDGQANGSITAQDIRDLIVSVGAGNQEFNTAVYDEFITAGVAIETATSAPNFSTFRDGIKAYAFPSNKMTQGFFQIHIQHGYKKDTDMSFHVHWGHSNAAPTGDVKWQIEYSIARGYGIEAWNTSTTLTTTQTAGNRYIHHITNDDDMPILGVANNVEPDCVIIARIFRDPGDAADTFPDEAFLFHIDLHYQKSRDGTVERNRPWLNEGWTA